VVLGFLFIHLKQFQVIMELIMNLVGETKISTLSKILHQETELIFTLEDGFNEVKIHGKTRIPAGRYKLIRVFSGRFFEAYKKRFGFPFAIGVENVPNFDLIRIHGGNTVEHTEGCPLTGMEGVYNKNTDAFEVRQSLVAYQKFWRYVAPEMVKDHVYLTINR
jgi:hypothetical protein